MPLDGKAPATRAELVRTLGTARYQPTPWPAGFWMFNTHHQSYQAALPPHGKFFTFAPFLLEATDAQFELWLERVRAARRLVATAMEADTDA